ncbi:hypothetical protein [Streptomyces sp. SID13031]|uniref:hypothetical protein n=1 Tax=Streptomyces sp. SID13031 TaxID=2706046 RepID=UPI0013C96510|nr:hypothetical protein [Streptomyces sp. SID13031]NEA33538.1 hypothetical protein [Streptomyces sp. SID13031]
MRPRTFELVRYRDLSGVSGTGVVAEGCVFTDGSVALRWRGTNPATAVWPDIESVLAVHGHQGATEVQWLEGEESVPYAGADAWAEPAESADGWTAPEDTWSAPAVERGGPELDLEHLFGGQHNVRPPGSVSDPSALPPSRARGWAGARHLR